MNNLFLYLSVVLLLLSNYFYGQTDKNKKDNEVVVYQVKDLHNGEFLKEFMLIGPFPNNLPEGITNYFHLEKTCLGFSKDYLISTGGELNTEPFIGQEVKYGTSEKLIWQKFISPTDKVDLKKIFTPNDKVVAYAAIWINSEKAQEKLMGIGSNDGMKVWLNGEMLIKVHKPRTVNVDDEYLKLKLEKGLNLLLIKIEQGFGGWGFVLRPVDSKTAWEQVQKNLNVAMNSEFKVVGDFIEGTIGHNNIVGQLSDLPMAKVNFKAVGSRHEKTINVPVGTYLKLSKRDFPAIEYAITISFETNKGLQTTYAYMNTVGDIVEESRLLMYKDLPQVQESPMADYYLDFIETVQWLDQANKLWEHPYGYRRYLDGIKNAVNGMEKLENSTNPFDGIFPKPAKMKFSKSKMTLTSKWQVFDANHSDDYIAEKLNDHWEKKFNTTVNYTKDNHKKNIIYLELSNSKKIGQPEGSYLLEIKKEKIVIKAKSRQGLYYGLSTLLQALDQNITIPIGTITDQPAFSVRSVVLTKTKAILSEDFKRYIKQLSNLRYNEIYLPSNAYLHLDEPERLLEIQEVFDYCKQHFIEPVPYIETFGAGTLTRVLDPCLDEGIFHKNEKWKVSEQGIIELNVPSILDCENSTIHVYTENGKELERYVDYKVLSSKKPKILVEDSNLYNTELVLSYDAVDFSIFSHPASCPSDPHGWELQENVIANVLTLLKPDNFHISQDEAGLINKCSRCLARGLTNQEIMIDQINRVHKIIRKYDSKVGIYIWGDLFNDYQNAPKIGIEGSIIGLPKDIMVHDWNYIGVYHSDKVQTVNQMNFYLEKGYKTGGVAWFEPANILDILQTGERNKELFLGIMHSAWAKFEYSLLPVAEANWTGKTILNDLKF
jgi:hypothetical protein